MQAIAQQERTRIVCGGMTERRIVGGALPSRNRRAVQDQVAVSAAGTGEAPPQPSAHQQDEEKFAG